MAEPAAWSPRAPKDPVSFVVERLGSVGSTNTWLLDQAREGAPAGLVVVADHQVSGRGRLTRHWEAPQGTSLLVSVLLRPRLPPAGLYACTAAVALAAAQACSVVAGVEPGVKWPNDLYVGEDKLAGILAEADPRAKGGAPGSIAVVVGLGCNLFWAGVDGATSLSDHASRAFTRDALLRSLLECLEPRVPLLQSDEGRAALIAELRARCVTIGRAVRIERMDGTTLVGLATRLEADGRLAVATGHSEVLVAEGDVVHLRPSSLGE